MYKRLFLSAFLIITAFSSLSLAASVPSFRVRFKINTPFLVESNATLAIPPGEYVIKDIGRTPDPVLSLDERKSGKHMAWLTTVRIDRYWVGYNDPTRVVFDFENSPPLPELPILRKVFLPNRDGYEILGAVYEKRAGLIEVASLRRTTVTEESVKVETAPVEPEPAPAAEPEPAPAPVVEQPREEVKPVEPAPEPVQPIRERRRVRKD